MLHRLATVLPALRALLYLAVTDGRVGRTVHIGASTVGIDHKKSHSVLISLPQSCHHAPDETG